MSKKIGRINERTVIVFLLLQSHPPKRDGLPSIPKKKGKNVCVVLPFLCDSSGLLVDLSSLFNSRLLVFVDFNILKAKRLSVVSIKA